MFNACSGPVSVLYNISLIILFPLLVILITTISHWRVRRIKFAILISVGAGLLMFLLIYFGNEVVRSFLNTLCGGEAYTFPDLVYYFRYPDEFLPVIVGSLFVTVVTLIFSSIVGLFRYIVRRHQNKIDPTAADNGVSKAWGVKLLIITLLALIVLTILGATIILYGAINKNNETVKIYSQPATQKGELNLDREGAFKILTANAWCNSAYLSSLPPTGFGGTSQNYQFKSDGTFKWTHFSDYLEGKGDGTWNFIMRSGGTGHILMSTGEMWHFRLQDDGTLLLRNMTLGKCNPLTVQEGATANSLPTIPEPKLLNELSVNPWFRTNSQNLAFRPTKITFTKDGRALAEYRNGECLEETYMTIHTDPYSLRAGVSSFPVDTSKKSCDSRGKDQQIYSSFGEMNFSGDLLIIGGESYSAINMPQSGREIIGSILGYSDIVNIQVAYNTPIVAGKPTIFSVEMTNISKNYVNKNPVTLQRFSLTKDYPQGYRRDIDKHALYPVDEIVGIDLGNKVLGQDEKYSFDVPVVFNEPGLQRVYINGLMYGPTQGWDTAGSYEFNVLESTNQ